MTTPQVDQRVNPVHEVEDPHRGLMYVIAAVLLVVLTVISLFTYRHVRQTAAANQKADQLIAALDQAGARTPDRAQVARVLGTDGGAICEDPSAALRRATLYGVMMNGAAGPGQRPVMVDERVVRFQLLVMKIYCPGQLPDFQKVVNDLDFSSVVKQ